MFDVFDGPGVVGKATINLGLRGCVPDTKCGPRYDETEPLVLARIGLDVSAGKCDAKNDVTSTTTNFVLSQSYSRQSGDVKICFIVLACLGFWNKRLESWLWDVTKIQTLAAQTRTAGTLAFFLRFRITVQEATVSSGWERGQQRLAPCCSQVSGDKW